MHLEVLQKIYRFALELGFSVRGLDFSPIKGAKGNIEYLLYMKKQPPQEEIGEDAIKALVADSHAELES